MYFKIETNMTKSGISIIILTLNGVKHLERLPETFLETNTHAPVELIIIDHGSTDKTSEVVSLYATRAFIRLINRGRPAPAHSCRVSTITTGGRGWPPMRRVSRARRYLPDKLL